jgi:hypothetical protein
VKNRTDALRRLEEETRQARERFEGEARKFPLVWASYLRWRSDVGEPIRQLVEGTPELARRWSAYLRFTARLKLALSRPSWPGIISQDDPTPPSGKNGVG